MTQGNNKKLLGPDGKPVDMSDDAVYERWWRRSPGEYEETANHMLVVAKSLKKAGLPTSMVAACTRATVLLAEMYIAKRSGMVRRT